VTSDRLSSGGGVASDPQIGRWYGAHVRYLLYVLVLFTIAFLAAVSLVARLSDMMLSGSIDLAPSGLRGGVIVGAPVVGGIIYLLWIHTTHGVVIRMHLWQVTVESMLISGYAALDHVRASEASSSAVGEGLVEALGGEGI
jgi:hypothetical protein